GAARSATLLALVENGRVLLSTTAARLGRASRRPAEEASGGERGATLTVRHDGDRVAESGPHFTRACPLFRVEASLPRRSPVRFEAPGLVETVFPPRLRHRLARAIPGRTRVECDRSGAGIEPGNPFGTSGSRGL